MRVSRSRSRLPLLYLVGLLLPSTAWAGPVIPFEGAPEWTAQVSGQLGRSLAVGDFNGDQVLDIAAGDPTEAAGGYVSIFWGDFTQGDPSGLTLHQDPANPDAGARFGEAILAVDMDRDGTDELAVGAPGRNGVGAVYLFRWNDVAQTMELAWDYQPAAPAGSFGTSLARGGIDVGGGMSLVVGDPDHDAQRGRVTVFDLNGSDWATVTGVGTERLGAAVGTAKLWGPDNGDALVIGAPEGQNLEGNAVHGRVYALPGPLAQGSNDPRSGSNQVYQGMSVDHQLGARIAGPLFLDATDDEDILVSAPGADGGAGWIYSLLGSNGAPPAMNDTLHGVDSGAPVGVSLAPIPDWDMDRCDEVAVGIGDGGGGVAGVWIASSPDCSGSGGNLSLEAESWDLFPGGAGADFGAALVVAPGLNGHSRGSLLVGAPGATHKVQLFAPTVPVAVVPRDYRPIPDSPDPITVYTGNSTPFAVEVVLMETGEGVPGVATSWTLDDAGATGLLLDSPTAITDGDGRGWVELVAEPTASGTALLHGESEGHGFTWPISVAAAPDTAGLELIAKEVAETIHPEASVPLAVQSSNDAGSDLTGFAVQWEIIDDGSRRDPDRASLELPGTTPIVTGGSAHNTLHVGPGTGIVRVEATLDVLGTVAKARFDLLVTEAWTGAVELVPDRRALEIRVGTPVQLGLQVLTDGEPTPNVPVGWRVASGDLGANLAPANLTDEEGRARATVTSPVPGPTVFEAEVVQEGKLHSLQFTVDWRKPDELPSAYGCQSAPGGPGGLALALALALLLGLGVLGRRRGRAPAGGLLLVLLLGLVSTPAGAEPPAEAAPPAEEPLRLAYLGVQHSSEAHAVEVRAISEFAQSELGRLGVYSVLGLGEIQALLGLEQQKQLLGCADESAACLTELGGSLGAGRLLSGNLTQIGRSVILNFSLLDVESARLVHRAGVRVTVGETFEPVLDRIPALMREIAEADPEARARLAAAPPPPLATAPPPPAPTGGAVTPDAPTPPAAGTPAPGTPGAPPLPEGHALVLALRADIDPFSPGAFPGLQIAWAHRRFGAAAVLLLRPWETPSAGAPQRVIGGRLEGRFLPLRRPTYGLHLGLGATLLGENLHARVGAGGVLTLGPVDLGLDLAYERLLTDSEHFNPNVLVLGLSVGLSLTR